MIYLRYIPSPPLDKHIDYFYYLEGAMPHRREKILPAGWLDLEINFGGAISVYDASDTKAVATCVDSWWAGVWSTYGTVAWPTNIQLLGIHFKPGGAYPFLKFPLSELHNQIVSAYAIWGTSVAELHEQLYATPTIHEKFALLERLLLARHCEVPYGLDAVRHGVREILRHHGALSVQVLSDQMGISHNYLLGQFKRMVGISPKALARLYRLKYALHSIDPMQPVDWALLANQSHYYDQSHFNNDFRTFTGHTPTEYLRLRRQAYITNPERDQLLHVLSIE